MFSLDKEDYLSSNHYFMRLASIKKNATQKQPRSSLKFKIFLQTTRIFTET